MHNNLVIVESPAKAKTIEKFLGSGYKVMSSYGHIRDLKKKELSIDETTLSPVYEVPGDKASLVEKLRESAEKADKVWLASDEDREGEAISWHLSEVLGLNAGEQNRIVFHEITKPAILSALEHPRSIDMNLVNAQQARRVLDRLVGFKLSPVLWRKVKPALSAGRVQSVAVRLIVEREREIHNFKSESYYRVSAVFVTSDGEELRAEVDKRFSTREQALEFLQACRSASFSVEEVVKKPLRRSPAAPFTTSTLQQEAARKLGFTVAQTMMVAQRLYESGHITYMRTDSLNLSRLFVGAAKGEIEASFGKEYSSPRTYHTHSKGAQEAHEAIRPTYVKNQSINGQVQEKRLYDLIWKRTVACQMADAKIEKTTLTISVSGREEKFVANGEVIKFDGYLKVYRDAADADLSHGEAASNALPNLAQGDILSRREIVSTERFVQGPVRYTEASLVHKLEELGIGRPSTYAPTISTIQQREYVVKGDKKGEERSYTIDTLKGTSVKSASKSELVGNEKGKLLPTDTGTVVNDFLLENFPSIMDYNFTAKVERQFDRIAEGEEQWTDMVTEFNAGFEPTVKSVINARAEHKAGERQIGVDPKTGRPVLVKIGRYGPVVQIGQASETHKPLFAQVPKDKSIETITLEEAMELFKFPRTLGKYEGEDVNVGRGRFGPYVLHAKKYVSIPKGSDPMTLTLEEAITLIEQKRSQESKKLIKSFNEGGKIEILSGRYGSYISFNGNNYRIPKNLQSTANDLTREKCIEIIEAAPVKKKKVAARKKQ